ncbi:hypothetical protein K7432_005005 [Basidiobolus ranarum]
MEADQDLLDLLDEIEEQQSQQSQIKVPEDVLEIEKVSTPMRSTSSPKFLRTGTGYSSKSKVQMVTNNSEANIAPVTESPLPVTKNGPNNDKPSNHIKNNKPMVDTSDERIISASPQLHTSNHAQTPTLSGSQTLQKFLYKKPKNNHSDPSKNPLNSICSTSTKNSEGSPKPSAPLKPHRDLAESVPVQKQANDKLIAQSFNNHRSKDSSRLVSEPSSKHGQEHVDPQTPSKPKGSFLASLNVSRLQTPTNQTLSKSFSEPRQNIRNDTATLTSHTNRKNSSTGKIKSRIRRLPGPAGDMLAMGSFDPKTKPIHQDAPGSNILSSPKTPSRNGVPSFQEDDFVSGAWSKMLLTLNLPKYTPSTVPFVKNASPFLSYNIQYILDHGFQKKIPYVILMIKETRSNEINVGVTFVDPTGEISGTIHRKVVEMYPDDISTGTVLVLQQVSVFSPSLHSHYLNVTPQNILHLFPSTREEVLSPSATQSSCQPNDPSYSPLREKSKSDFSDSLFHQTESFSVDDQQSLISSSTQAKSISDPRLSPSNGDIPLFLKRKSSELIEASNMLDEPKLPGPKKQLFTDRLFSKNLPSSPDKSLPNPMSGTSAGRPLPKDSNSSSNAEQSPPAFASQSLFSSTQPVIEEDLDCLLDGIEESFFEDDLI